MDKGDGTVSEAVTVADITFFPFLDMELYWTDQDLRFKVHLKENQKLKYLNRGSAHMSACFQAIPSGVLGRLAKLTSLTDESGLK